MLPPVHWSGDGLARFGDLACVLRAALSMGLSGFPFYSHDIGGLLGVPTPQLYVRWAQLGLFASHARVRGLGPREPWAFGPRADPIFRQHSELRHRLMPCIWGEALECGRTAVGRVPSHVAESFCGEVQPAEGDEGAAGAREGRPACLTRPWGSDTGGSPRRG
jgi:hypothetical protein